MVLELIKPRVEELPEMQEPFSELLQDFRLSKSKCWWNAISLVASMRPKVWQRGHHESQANPQRDGE